MNQLSINQLSLTYKSGIKAVDNISLEITNGMFGLLGPNGAGKSSLMKTVVGLQKPGTGDIFFNGTDVVKNPMGIRKHLGYLPQDFGVYSKVSAYDLLQHLAVLKGITDAAARRQQIMGLLEKVNLLPVRNREVHTFSGGMKQRFGVAQALLGNPQIIIADEPTAGLDPEERNRFNTLLSEISENIIVILSTHLVEDVRNLCAQMAVIHKGAVLAAGNPSAMIKALEGKIWTRKIQVSELPDYQHYRIISNQLVEKEMHISVYADTQPDGFYASAPILEHVYFHTLYRQ
ncbi:MAG TPA: ABC transporter ATP-binding protein [Chitinophaga sp.]|uniref:ABC transporter ATP-binding protein n=1 Tax=Chitinophaga sp. TaxID=1869181 RepID=UPI002BB38BED|nr:ABC transporter ATP-binding protein [Chitinophaga sp.]HVI46841.1 ABC transporter ATP-binding protein [Chitinophaga sp.]